MALWWLWQIEAIWPANSWMHWWVTWFAYIMKHFLYNSYSWKIIWLEVAESNNDPSLITHYYLHAVEKLKGTGIMMLLIISCFVYIGCPRFLRTDLGSENSNIAFLQPLLQHHLSNTVSHFYGKSIMNQVYLYYYYYTC